MLKTIIYLIVIVFILDRFADIPIAHEIALHIKEYFYYTIDLIYGMIHEKK